MRSAAFPGGSEGDGFEGVRGFIREHRENDFVDNLCRKLLAYALGPQPACSRMSRLIEEMRGKLAANDYRFETLIESIVTSSAIPERAQARKPARQHER